MIYQEVIKSMTKNLEELLEDKVFYYFSEISKIPRQSGNEKAISDYLKNFALDKGLFVRQDEFLNILIKKPATPGYEKAPIVILQGHMDMVCEKNEGTIHDFKVDPIKLIKSGDYIMAEGTTLGADNGIAIAYALALLDSTDIPHPGLEIVITTDEEVGLTGALEMDTSDFEGDYFINLDSEEEGELVVSCAGGLRALLGLPLEYETINPTLYETIQLNIKGLKGGHSGMEIDKNRGNAIVLMGNIFSRLSQDVDFRISNLMGGMKDNVIPRESFATLNIPKNQIKQFNEAMALITSELKNEFKTSDPDLYFLIDPIEKADITSVVAQDSLSKIIFLLMALPNGVQSMSADIEGLVESSINLGRLYQEEDNLYFEFASRSSVRSKKYRMVELLKLFAKQVGGSCIESKDYPEWPLKRDSELLKLCIATFERLNHNKPVVKGIHAGLEAGVFMEKLPHLDAISFGPDIYDVHSPDEKMSITSVKNTYEYLKEILKSIK